MLIRIQQIVYYAPQLVCLLTEAEAVGVEKETHLPEMTLAGRRLADSSAGQYPVATTTFLWASCSHGSLFL